MLVLSRKLFERIVLPTLDITVQVVAIKPGVVRLGIEAPRNVTVMREELCDSAQAIVELSARGLPAIKPDANFSKVVRNRLGVMRIGLEVLRKQIHMNQSDDAETTLDDLENDIASLERRLAQSVPEWSEENLSLDCTASL